MAECPLCSGFGTAQPSMLSLWTFGEPHCSLQLRAHCCLVHNSPVTPSAVPGTGIGLVCIMQSLYLPKRQCGLHCPRGVKLCSPSALDRTSPRGCHSLSTWRLNCVAGGSAQV